jgi:acetyl esterase
MLHLARAVRAPEAVVDLHRVEDLTVPGAAGSLRARLYRPSAERHLATVVYLHGGGFVIGDLDTHDNICRELARAANAVVVSVDYRLAPEHRYPAAADDAIAATRWVIANAGELGGSDVVAVAGDSAGGNLAAVVTQQLHADGISLAAQFLIYPAVAGDRSGFPSFTENGEGYLLDRETIAWFERHYVADGTNPQDARLAPIHAKDLAGLPPAVIVTAEYDPLRDEGEHTAACFTPAASRSTRSGPTACCTASSTWAQSPPARRRGSTRASQVSGSCSTVRSTIDTSAVAIRIALIAIPWPHAVRWRISVVADAATQF